MAKRRQIVRSKNSYHSYAIKILKESNRGMTTAEITDKISRFRKVRGKDPDRTISSVLQRSDYISRVGFNTYKYTG